MIKDEEILAAVKAVEDMGQGFASVGSKLEAQLAEFNETARKIIVPSPEDIKSREELQAEGKAKLEQAGVMGGITDFEIWDIPVGQALVGGFAAVFASELIDGFLVKQGDFLKGTVKLIGAGAAVKWGPRVFGKTGSKALAILLAYDGIRSLIPIDAWAKRGATTVTGMIPGGGLGGFTKDVGGNPAGNGQGDYYEERVRGAR